MDANVVFQIAKALTIEEQRKLLTKLKKDLDIHIVKKKPPILDKQDAINYLLKAVFNKK
ncbi:hypothetical protein SHK09_14755 [Polaribacter sp. PL03]|nr:hypothetical protein [Polaribacter sp. PL03]